LLIFSFSFYILFFVSAYADSEERITFWGGLVKLRLAKNAGSEYSIEKSGVLTDQEGGIFAIDGIFSYDIMFPKASDSGVTRHIILRRNPNEKTAGNPVGNDHAALPWLRRLRGR
jgi:hypothetical protein